MIFKFGEQLLPVDTEEWVQEPASAVFLTDSRHAEETLRRAGLTG